MNELQIRMLKSCVGLRVADSSFNLGDFVEFDGKNGGVSRVGTLLDIGVSVSAIHVHTGVVVPRRFYDGIFSVLQPYVVETKAVFDRLGTPKRHLITIQVGAIDIAVLEQAMNFCLSGNRKWNPRWHILTTKLDPVIDTAEVALGLYGVHSMRLGRLSTVQMELRKQRRVGWKPVLRYGRCE
jgi:hypothetical protein